MGEAELYSHLQAGKLLPVYGLFGIDATLVEEAVVEIRKLALTRASDFNRDELRAGDTPVDKVVQAAGTLPMMAPRRYVHLAAVHQLKAKDAEPLAAYVASPAPTTVLVLSGEKLDQRTKLGQALAKSGGLFVLEPPRQQELPSYLMRRAKRRGVAIEHEAAQLLADLVGVELGNLDRALEKAQLFAGPDATVTADHVEATVAPTRVHSIFELTDAIGRRDLGQASLLLRNALSGGESGLPILGMITRQIRQLLTVKRLKAEGASAKDIAAGAGVRPFLVDALVAQAKRYDMSELVLALDAALAADVRMKSTRIDHGIVLERLLLDIAGAAPRA